jgi:glycosyltransferase involved in cell wall biosynthesis
MMQPTALFVSYNGLLEPLGQSQVLAYVERLSRDHGHRIELLSFEKGVSTPAEVTRLNERLDACGIKWHRLSYHRRPRVAATTLDVVAGVRSVLGRVAGGVRFIHARSHVPALMADIVRSAKGAPFVFDHRGLMAEEYADAGIWRRGGLLYRAVTRLERRFLATAGSVVVLTDVYRRELALGAKCVTIPCAVDLRAYCPRPDVRPDYDLVYAGSWTGIYLADEMLRFFDALRQQRPAARLLVLVPQGQPLPESRLGVEAQHAKPEEVPAKLAQARAGISLRRAGPAQRAASPVKVSEYLATGLPVVTNAGVGDLDEILRRTGTGVVLSAFSGRDLDDGARHLLRLLDSDPGVTTRCRRVAQENFDLEGAVRAYSEVYRRMESLCTLSI